MSKVEKGVISRLFHWWYLSYVKRNVLLVSVKGQYRMPVISKMFSILVHGAAAATVKDFTLIASNSCKFRFLFQSQETCSSTRPAFATYSRFTRQSMFFC